MSEGKKVTDEEDAQVNVIDIIPRFNKSITLKEYLELKRIETHHQYNEDVSFTNQIMFLHNVSEQSQIYYYIPVYTRLKLKNILSLDFQNLLATVSVDIKISVYYGQLSEKMKGVLLKKMILDIPKNLPVPLIDDKTLVIRQEDSQKCFHFLVRNKIIISQVRAHTALSPFENASINICLSMKRINQVYVQNKEQVHLKAKFFFNFMELPGEQHSQQRFLLPSRKGFGMYKISQKKKTVTVHEQLIHPEDIEVINYERIDKLEQKSSEIDHYLEVQQDYISEIDLMHQNKNNIPKKQIDLLKIVYQIFNKTTSNSENQIDKMNKMKPTSIYDQTDDDRVKCFQYISFTTYLYKAPLSTTIFLLVQLSIIGFVNICIFYQDPKQKGKTMLNMATLLVALVALVPGIKEQIGNGGIFTLAEGCVIAEIFTIVLCFAHMINGINSNKSEFILGQDALAILCIVITVFIGVALIGLYLYHKLFEKKLFHGPPKSDRQNLDFDRTKWINEKCDQEFYYYYEGENQHLKIVYDCKQLYQTNQYKEQIIQESKTK